mgnify:CR=1 FL=1
MKALVVYATITGNNEDVADIITDALEDLDVDVEETEITMADPADFNDADICVICPYTYDEGALPEEGLDFYDDLQEEHLDGKVYGVAGSGDTFYGDDFCVAVDKFGEALCQNEATSDDYSRQTVTVHPTCGDEMQSLREECSNLQIILEAMEASED